jgi:CheY-like chemotaxis protein
MQTRVVVLADDLIWQTRLVATLEAAGATTVRTKTAPEFQAALAHSDRAVIDLTASNYEPIAAIRAAAGAGLAVLCVGQHDDSALRKRALAAGADRVFAYRKLFEDGPATIGAWLATAPLGSVP